MLKSANIGELVKAIAEAQTDYKALVARHTAKIPGKDGKSGYEYAYADLNDGLDALQGTLNSRGVAVIQEAYTVERGIEVATTLALGEQWMESRPLFMPVSGGAQAVGSAVTYARRYSLFPMVGLAPADDDGEEANRNVPPPNKPAPKPRAAKPAESDVAPRQAADSLGPRCDGKAAGIAAAVDKRIRELSAIRQEKDLMVTWRRALVEAGIDVLKYGEPDVAPPLDRPELLTIPDGKVLNDYLARMLDGPPADKPPKQSAGEAKAECGLLWVRLRQLSPDDFTDTGWKADWAKFAGLDEWPDRPTAADHVAAAAGMQDALERIEAP